MWTQLTDSNLILFMQVENVYYDKLNICERLSVYVLRHVARRFKDEPNQSGQNFLPQCYANAEFLGMRNIEGKLCFF